MTYSGQPADAVHALSALPFAVFVLDGEYRIGYVNGAAEQFFGQGANGLAGRKLDTLFPASSPLFTLILQAVAGRMSVAEYDVTISGPNGRERQLAVTVSPRPASVARLASSRNTIRRFRRSTATPTNWFRFFSTS